MVKAKIGVTMSRDYSGGYPRDFLRSTYTDAIIKFGGVPVLLPNVETSVSLLEECDGLLLTGGGDFDPACFKREDQGTEWGGVSPDRDRVEMLLIAEANRRQMPVFGICRGLQALTVSFGGTLIQDIPSALADSPFQHSQSQARREVTHPVAVEPDSRLAQILGCDNLAVNSFHHQAVAEVPLGWRVSAQAPDGIVEALEFPGDRFLMGVQWHPEDLVSDEEPQQRLFRRFIASCEGHRE